MSKSTMKYSYALRILLSLRAGQMTAYRLSKELSFGARRVSSGTLYPALKKLTEEDLISSSRDGRRIFYFLTEKGSKYVEEFISFRSPVVARLFRDFAHVAMLDDSIVPDLESLKTAREVTSDYYDLFLKILGKALKYKSSNQDDKYSSLLRKVRAIAGRSVKK